MADSFKKLLSKIPAEFKKTPITIVATVIVTVAVTTLLGPTKSLVEFLAAISAQGFLILWDQFQRLWLVHLVIFSLAVLLVIYLSKQRQKINLLAGTFKDDFKNGLSKWDFDGEGWNTHESQREGTYLEVTNSGQGGISRKGFKLDNYLFSFRSKVITSASGWIVRAEDRSKYFMIQCLVDQTNKLVKIRPHFLFDEVFYLVEEQNLVDKELTKSILKREWFDVEIEVNGNNINLFINKKFIYHYELPSPIRLEDKWVAQGQPTPVSVPTQGDIQTEAKIDAEKAREISLIISKMKSVSYVSGRVGFRCDGPEKTWIQDVKVKPIL